MVRMEALPVSVELPGVLAAEVAAFVEDEAGWQVVGAGGALAPVLTIAGRPDAGPRCVVVTDGAPPAELVADALLAGALDVVAWPAERQRLLEAPLRVRGTQDPAAAPPVFRIAGVCGGAGTSTVALAVAGLVAWAGGRALVVGGDDLLALAGLDAWAGPGAVELAALAPADAAAEVAALARPVSAVDGLTVLGGGGIVGATTGWPADVVVADLRVPGDVRGADLAVARCDGSLRVAAGSHVPVVVVGDGPLDRAAAGRLLGRTPVGWLPHSARVARAGVAGRVPSALPGSWLAALRGVVTRVRP